jgi:hypothetical protein
MSWFDNSIYGLSSTLQMGAPRAPEGRSRARCLTLTFAIGREDINELFLLSKIQKIEKLFISINIHHKIIQ